VHRRVACRWGETGEMLHYYYITETFSPLFKGVAVVLSYIQFSISFFLSHTSDVCREIPLCMYDQMDLKLKFTAQGNIANYHAD
jgi:hypothetical protein